MCGFNMPNKLNVWDGTSWVDVTPKAFENGSWVTASPMYYDGWNWQDSAPTPEEFPWLSDTNTASNGAADTVSLAVPKYTVTNDFVVSICAQSSGPDTTPRLLSPAGVIPTLYTLSSGIRLYVAVWPWEPSKGKSVVWNVQGSTNTALMNLTYSGGDVANTSLTPVLSITEYDNVSQVNLPASQDFTSLYVVLTSSTNLTGVAWPDGVEEEESIFPQFGTKQIGLVAADTPGAGASPGNVLFDSTVDIAAVALIQIPGKSDGLPTWILGDSAGSVLGSTTRLG